MSAWRPSPISQARHAAQRQPRDAACSREASPAWRLSGRRVMQRARGGDAPCRAGRRRLRRPTAPARAPRAPAPRAAWQRGGAARRARHGEARAPGKALRAAQCDDRRHRSLLRRRAGPPGSPPAPWRRRGQDGGADAVVTSAARRTTRPVARQRVVRHASVAWTQPYDDTPHHSESSSSASSSPAAGAPLAFFAALRFCQARKDLRVASSGAAARLPRQKIWKEATPNSPKP